MRRALLLLALLVTPVARADDAFPPQVGNTGAAGGANGVAITPTSVTATGDVCGGTATATDDLSCLHVTTGGEARFSSLLTPPDLAADVTITTPAVTGTLAILGANTFTGLQTTVGITNGTTAITNSSTLDQQGAIANSGPAVPTGGVAGQVWINDVDGVTSSGPLYVKSATMPTLSVPWLFAAAPSAVTIAGTSYTAVINTDANVTNNGSSSVVGLYVLDDTTTLSSGSPVYWGIASGSGNNRTVTGAGATFNQFYARPAAITQTSGTATSNGLSVLIPASASIVTGGTMNGIIIVSPTTSGPAAGTLTGLKIDNLTSAGAGTENAITVGTGWDNQINATGFTVDGDGDTTALTYNTVTNCTDSSGDAACAAAVTGAIVIDAGDTDTIVNTTAVTANSNIIVMFDSSLGTRHGAITCNVTAALPTISARSAGSSFTVKTDVAPITDKGCYTFLFAD